MMVVYLVEFTDSIGNYGEIIAASLLKDAANRKAKEYAEEYNKDVPTSCKLIYSDKNEIWHNLPLMVSVIEKILEE